MRKKKKSWEELDIKLKAIEEKVEDLKIENEEFKKIMEEEKKEKEEILKKQAYFKEVINEYHKDFTKNKELINNSGTIERTEEIKILKKGHQRKDWKNSDRIKKYI